VHGFSTHKDIWKCVFSVIEENFDFPGGNAFLPENLLRIGGTFGRARIFNPQGHFGFEDPEKKHQIFDEIDEIFKFL
jgi:hypothetical protein